MLGAAPARLDETWAPGAVSGWPERKPPFQRFAATLGFAIRALGSARGRPRYVTSASWRPVQQTSRAPQTERGRRWSCRATRARRLSSNHERISRRSACTNRAGRSYKTRRRWSWVRRRGIQRGATLRLAEQSYSTIIPAELLASLSISACMSFQLPPGGSDQCPSSISGLAAGAAMIGKVVVPGDSDGRLLRGSSYFSFGRVEEDQPTTLTEVAHGLSRGFQLDAHRVASHEVVSRDGADGAGRFAVPRRWIGPAALPWLFSS